MNTTACIQLANKLQLNNYLKLEKQKRKNVLHTNSTFSPKSIALQWWQSQHVWENVIGPRGVNDIVWLSARRRALEQSSEYGGNCVQHQGKEVKQ